MTQCDMQVPETDSSERRYRQCKRLGRYIHTDRYGERWVFCRQHLDAYTAAMG